MYIYTYIHISICICIYTYMYMCVCMYTYACALAAEGPRTQGRDRMTSCGTPGAFSSRILCHTCANMLCGPLQGLFAPRVTREPAVWRVWCYSCELKNDCNKMNTYINVRGEGVRGRGGCLVLFLCFIFVFFHKIFTPVNTFLKRVGVGVGT